MARAVHHSPPPDEDEDELYSAPATRRSPPVRGSLSQSPAPSPDASSEKENRSVHKSSSRQLRGKGRLDMAPPIDRPGKRRRVEPLDAEHTSQAAHERHLDEVVDTHFYDPDQDINERRALRKGLRDLNRNLNDSRAEFLAPGSTGLADTLQKANQYFSSVRQTSDATLDSRLLVTTADLSYKKTVQLTLGDTAQGVDVDEFVSKCISFMRRGDQEAGNVQRRRQRIDIDDPDDDEGEEEQEGDDGDALDWAHLGKEAFKHNLRPPVPGFLLGPLSLQKRLRQLKPRQGRLERQNRTEEVRPEELKAGDIEKAENSNLTLLCTKIRGVLGRVAEEGRAAAEADATEDMDEIEQQKLLIKHNICDDGGVNFYRFVINPHSFGQTVENMFYVSFLIRDGSAGVGEDSNGFPTLHPTQPRKISEMKEQGVQKNQAVFNLSWPTWQDLVDAFQITEPVIPNRESDEGAACGRRGWYG
ncbi:MAG: nuclear protein [Geoglossum umbratile]|nr:MAG: nuclear protein [Geoglossum umbratile]